jgi:hypothetical protein
MVDSRPTSTDDGAERASADGADGDDAESTEQLRRQVEETYDFDDFGPQDMARMSPEEWEAAFDADSWITGEDLIERVSADLRNRIADRDVFARLERVEDGLLAYSDEGYAVVHPDGSVEGRGTVLRDVKPTVALCSMDEYEVEEPPEGDLLPEPEAVPEGGGELGNQMLQVLAIAQLVAGLGLFAAWLFRFVETIFAPVLGLGFVLFSVLLFLLVANARLSDRFRAEEYRDRLRAVGIGSDERPEFLPERYREEERPSSSLTPDERDGGSSERPTTDPESDDSRPSA